MKALVTMLAIPLVASAACSALTSLDDLGGQGSDAAIDATDGSVVAVQLTNKRARDLVLDGTTLFWVEPFDAAVGSLAEGATTPIYLANGTAGFNPNTLVIDATNVYWSSGDQRILRCAKTGCANTPVTLIDTTPPDGGPGGIYPLLAGVDAQWIYFVDLSPSAALAYKMPLTGGALTQIGPPLCADVNYFSLASNKIYFTCQGGTVARLDVSLNVIESLTGQSPPQGAGPFTLQGTALFYGQFFASPGGALYKLDTTNLGGASSPVATGQNNVASIAADSTDLYWTTIGTVPDNGEGALVRCPFSSCSNPTTLLTGLDEPTSIAIGDATIYWTNLGNGGTPNVGVWRMPKPP